MISVTSHHAERVTARWTPLRLLGCPYQSLPSPRCSRTAPSSPRILCRFCTAYTPLAATFSISWTLKLFKLSVPHWPSGRLPSSFRRFTTVEDGSTSSLLVEHLRCHCVPVKTIQNIPSSALSQVARWLFPRKFLSTACTSHARRTLVPGASLGNNVIVCLLSTHREQQLEARSQRPRSSLNRSQAE